MVEPKSISDVSEAEPTNAIDSRAFDTLAQLSLWLGHDGRHPTGVMWSGHGLRRLRSFFGKTQAEMAQSLGVNLKTIANWERYADELLPAKVSWALEGFALCACNDDDSSPFGGSHMSPLESITMNMLDDSEDARQYRAEMWRALKGRPALLAERKRRYEEACQEAAKDLPGACCEECGAVRIPGADIGNLFCPDCMRETATIPRAEYLAKERTSQS